MSGCYHIYILPKTSLSWYSCDVTSSSPDKELYIVYVPKFNPYGSIYSVLFESANSMVMYHRAVGTHLGHNNYIDTKLWKINEKSKIKDLNSIIND